MAGSSPVGGTALAQTQQLPFSPRQADGSSIAGSTDEGSSSAASTSRIDSLRQLTTPRGQEEDPPRSPSQPELPVSAAASGAYRMVDIHEEGSGSGAPATARASANVRSSRGLCLAFVDLSADIEVRGGVWDCCVPAHKKVRTAQLRPNKRTAGRL